MMKRPRISWIRRFGNVFIRSGAVFRTSSRRESQNSRRMMRILLVLAAVCLARGQDDLDSAIRSVFGNGGNNASTTDGDFLAGLGTVVSQGSLQGIGAIEKCGEGVDQNVRTCVPYFNCDGQTRTIITDGQTDGFGIIDIRAGQDSPCDHYLDVCCKIPDTGIPSSVTTEKSTVDPKEPVVNITIPPVTPGRGNFCGIRNPDGIDFKIRGNKNNEAEYAEFPWMIEILKRDYDAAQDESFAICGGALITPIAVLTGAHCVSKFKVEDIKIRAGEWDTQTTRERVPFQERNVVDIIVHKDFHDKTLYNNVALLILNAPLEKADNLGTVCLPAQGELTASKNCFATGWGKDKFGQEGVYQVILKKIELPIVSHAKCQDALRTTRLGKFFNLHDSFICAGGEAGKDTCTGDGGGPLVCPDASGTKYYQAGIVSWGIGCGEENIPGVYTDVSKYRDWIDKQMAKQNLDTRPYRV